jgi:hypothetical protein
MTKITNNEVKRKHLMSQCVKFSHKKTNPNFITNVDFSFKKCFPQITTNIIVLRLREFVGFIILLGFNYWAELQDKQLKIYGNIGTIELLLSK